MKNPECLICKCNTCQDYYCKLESCSEECRENKVNPLLCDCNGYCASEIVDQVAPAEPLPFRKILVVNGEFYAGDSYTRNRSEAVVIEDEAVLKILIGTVFCRYMNGEMEFKRVEVFDVKGAVTDA